MRFSFALVIAAASGSACTSAEATDTGSDASSLDDIGFESATPDTAVDSAVTDSSTATDTAPTEAAASKCSKPVSGASPFAITLSGTGASEGGVVAGKANFFFPKGRVPGAEVVMAVARFYGAFGYSVSRGVLDSTLSATLSAYDPDCGDGVEGKLIGPDGGMDAKVTHNRLATTAIDLEYARMDLCPTGEVPYDASFGDVPHSGIPTAPIRVMGNVPLDPATFATVKSTPDHPFEVGEDGTSLLVFGKSAFDPFTSLTVDLSGVRDVMGVHPASLTTRKANAFLSASITDGTFATAPPLEAFFFGASGAATAGVLRASHGGVAGIPLVMLLGVGDQGAKTKLHLHHRLDCSSPGDASVTLISETGATMVIPTDCTAAMIDKVVDLPAGGKRWALLVLRYTPERHACHTYDTSLPFAYELDDIAFE